MIRRPLTALVTASSLVLGFGLFAACGSSDDAGLPSNKDAGTGGADGAAGQGGSAGGAGQTCGNGKLEGTEECDDDNSAGKDGCENDCSFTCIAGNPARDKCDDGNACNGVETCSSENRCDPGTPPADGTSCGTDSFCVGGNCVPKSCGDGQPQTGEECDDGDVDDTNGCTTACKFSCLSTDSTRDCSTSGDECAGTNVCDDTKHTCTGGTAKSDNDPCNGGAGYCASGVCTTAACGNSKPEPGEDCDDGNTDDTDGCTKACKFTCTAGTQCSDSNVCTLDQCNANKCANPADTSQNGKACTVGSVTGVCAAGACVPASCGDGIVNGNDQCDKAAQNGVPGSGCSASCTFECANNAACSDNNPCTGTEVCANITGGKTCQPGTPLAKGAVCLASPRSICDANGGQCKQSTCGDTIIDTGGGEQCEPPNTPTCDASCKTIAPVVCGDGKIGGAEQCDDGNKLNLDGCDSQCKYEVLHRMTKVEIQGGTSPAFCTATKNQLGNVALTNLARNELNNSLTAGINDGETNVLVQSRNLDDLTGVADPSFQLGIVSGYLDPAKGTWPAGPSNPIDWWFLLDKASVDSAGLPTSNLGAVLSAKNITAGPANAVMTLLLAGVPSQLEMRGAKIVATTSGTASVPAPPPAALAAGLVVFPEVIGDGSGQGLCGNITVESLAKIPAPESLTTSGPSTSRCRPGGSALNCGSGTKAYTYCGANQPVGASCNSLLDVLVGGCKAFFCATAVVPTQPDVAAGGPIQQLTLGAGNKIPTTQTNNNQDAYSSYLRIRGRRAHATGTQ